MAGQYQRVETRGYKQVQEKCQAVAQFKLLRSNKSSLALASAIKFMWQSNVLMYQEL